MNASTSAPDLQWLEQRWVIYQLEVAALRPALYSLCKATIEGRRGHTFLPGNEPPQIAVRGIMQPTNGEMNGISDAFGETTKGSYSARALSVATASIILLTFDTAIQSFAHGLSLPGADAMNAGDDIPSQTAGIAAVSASTLIWAAANSVRHLDEWEATAAAFRNPKNADDHKRRALQERSMNPIAAVLGVKVPITENVSYETFHLLTMLNPHQGSYERLERHVLRVGQDLVQRAGLAGAPIGVTISERIPRGQVADDQVAISDGIGRSASSLPGVDGHILPVRPVGFDENEKSST